MKSATLIQTLFFMLLIPLSTIAQDITPRDVTLKIIDRRGRPVSGIIVQAQARTEAAMTDDSGVYIFENLTDADSLVLMLPQYGETRFSIAEFDSVVVTLRSARNYTRTGFSNDINIGYTTINERQRTTPQNSIDVATLIKGGAKSLTELLQGRVPGLSIQENPGGSVTSTIRGISSVTLSSEPLVVVDGIPVGDLSAANRMLNVHDINTVDVVKDGSIYGARGANGVILITTK